MARPPLPLGSWGKIRHYPTADGRVRAVTQYRGHDGTTRQVERAGDTAAKADRALRDYLTERTADHTTITHAATRVRDLAPAYLERIRRDRADTTYDRYRSRLQAHILPRMGDLLLREVTPGRISAVFDAIRDDNPGIAGGTLRGIRSCISGLMQIAVDQDALRTNPTASVRRIEGGTKHAARAYDADEVADFLAKVDADEHAVQADLPDLLRFLFGTGCRFGEALALRWCDMNLTDEPIRVTNPDSGEQAKLPARSLWINGNLVAVSGKGAVRHGGKTGGSRGIIGLPTFLHTLLLVRSPMLATVGGHATDPVFPSATGGWRHPNNVTRTVKRLSKRIGHEEFVTHVGRKTVATLLAEAGQSTRQVADQLRHARISTTELYIGRGLQNPGAAAAIDAAHRPPRPGAPIPTDNPAEAPNTERSAS